MCPWYRKLWVSIGLRAVGVAILGSAYVEGGWLCTLVHAHPRGDATPGEFLLAAILFASASAGTALAALGGRLWEPVQLSQRWQASLSDPFADRR